jgi:hypothetical protein
MPRKQPQGRESTNVVRSAVPSLASTSHCAAMWPRVLRWRVSRKDTNAREVRLHSNNQ